MRNKVVFNWLNQHAFKHKLKTDWQRKWEVDALSEDEDSTLTFHAVNDDVAFDLTTSMNLVETMC